MRVTDRILYCCTVQHIRSVHERPRDPAHPTTVAARRAHIGRAARRALCRAHPPAAAAGWRAPAFGARMRAPPLAEPQHRGRGLRPAAGRGLGRGAAPARLFRARDPDRGPRDTAHGQRGRAAAVAGERDHADPRHVPAAGRAADAGAGHAARRLAGPAAARRRAAQGQPRCSLCRLRAALWRAGRRCPAAPGAGAQAGRGRRHRNARADHHHRRCDAGAGRGDAHAAARRRRGAGRRARLGGGIRAAGRFGHARAAGAARRGRPDR